MESFSRKDKALMAAPIMAAALKDLVGRGGRANKEARKTAARISLEMVDNLISEQVSYEEDKELEARKKGRESWP